MPLKVLVAALLNRKLKFCRHIRLKPKQEATILFFRYECWTCKKPQYCYTVYPKFSTVCGLGYDMWSDGDIDKSQQIQIAVQQFLDSDKGKGIKVGPIKQRFSKTVQNSYLSYGCYYCDAIFGDFYLSEAKSYVHYDWKTEGQSDKYIQHTIEVDLGKVVEERPHWCFSEDGHFCE